MQNFCVMFNKKHIYKLKILKSIKIKVIKLAHHTAYSHVIHSMNKIAEVVMHMTYVWDEPV
jgi:hypothetical protein